MTSGGSGSCAVDRWMTHPAFISFNKNGFWVSKFAATGSTSGGNITSLSSLPGIAPISSIDLNKMFVGSYDYSRNLDSHLLKNTEWGAIAYLAHSKYGMGNKNIYINNYMNNDVFKTGCVGNGPDTEESTTCQNQWYSTTGLNGSTTGNITGVYDMSGCIGEMVSTYIEGYPGSSTFTSQMISTYNSKYFDVYSPSCAANNYTYRILGDATGEMGPISDLWVGSWYNDSAFGVDINISTFIRGGYSTADEGAGLFSSDSYNGTGYKYYGFRFALAP